MEKRENRIMKHLFFFFSDRIERLGKVGESAYEEENELVNSQSLP